MVRMMREMKGGTDLLFGGGFNVATFKEKFKAPKTSLNEIDFEKELSSKGHLSFEERKEFIDGLKEKKQQFEDEAKEKFEEQKVIMKALQDHLYIKYQFPVLIPHNHDYK